MLWLRSATALVALALLTGCQSTPDTPLADAAPLPEAGDVLEPAPEFIPERVEGGSARENQPHIDWVLEKARDGSTTRVAGLDAVGLLEESGYVRELMELTPDMSLIELPSDSTSLAIRFDDECVVTQWGSGWYASSVEPVVAGGRCLVGQSVSLD